MLGIGAMISYLGDDGSTAAAVQASLGKVIDRITLDPDVDVSRWDSADQLRVRFADGSVLLIWDGGRSCCESRYMRTDDTLDEFTGATLTAVEVADAPDEKDEYGDVHEIQFLRLRTSKGIATFANHNEHNGYYGGFALKAGLE